MQSKIRRKPVVVRPSRIRREPVRLESKADLRKAEVRSREREVWGGVAGVLLFAMVMAAATVGIGAVTLSDYDPAAAAARAARFDPCYSADGPNCVLDGDTIYVGGAKVQVAGMEAPKIQGAQCEAERNKGIAAAVKLGELLNSGKVTVGKRFVDPSGASVRKVQVNGEDVGRTMIDAGVARRYGDQDQSWCAAAAS